MGSLIWEKMTRNVGHFGGSASMESMALTDEGISKGIERLHRGLGSFVAFFGCCPFCPFCPLI